MLSTDKFFHCTKHKVPFPQGAECPKCVYERNDMSSIPCRCREGKHCPICEILETHDRNIIHKIATRLNENMAEYYDSRQPTNDEVSIAWLLTYIEKVQGRLAVLQEVIDNAQGT